MSLSKQSAYGWHLHWVSEGRPVDIITFGFHRGVFEGHVKQFLEDKAWDYLFDLYETCNGPKRLYHYPGWDNTVLPVAPLYQAILEVGEEKLYDYLESKPEIYGIRVDQFGSGYDELLGSAAQGGNLSLYKKVEKKATEQAFLCHREDIVGGALKGRNLELLKCIFQGREGDITERDRDLALALGLPKAQAYFQEFVDKIPPKVSRVMAQPREYSFPQDIPSLAALAPL